MGQLQGESMVASYRYMGVSNPGIHMLGSNECDVSYQYGTRASFQYIFLHSTILRPKKPLGSWNLVNPLFSMNKAWKDECATRLQPLVDKYKPKQHQIFTIKKFRDLIVTTRSCHGDKKKSLIKKFSRDIVKDIFENR